MYGSIISQNFGYLSLEIVSLSKGIMDLFIVCFSEEQMKAKGISQNFDYLSLQILLALHCRVVLERRLVKCVQFEREYF